MRMGRSLAGAMLSLIAAQVISACAASWPPPVAPARPIAGDSQRQAHVAARRAGSRVPLVRSIASNMIIQRQPPPGSCHAIGSGLYSRPDPRCTPGALNPAVTQATVAGTICSDGWTSRVRPPERVTEREKAASMAAYGDTGSMSGYEYDHFVPLELGGATNDRRNLWPEPGASPNPKDAVEDELKHRVCDGQMTLAAAQNAIVRNWVALARRATNGGASRARCSLSARYDAQYADYDVYVTSNQPDQAVTVADASGHRGSWHTDASGYADVYFHSDGPRPGDRVTAHVGHAACSTTL
jgi:hypothetical protein